MRFHVESPRYVVERAWSEQRHGVLGELGAGNVARYSSSPVRSGLDGVPVDEDQQCRLGGGQIDIQMLGDASTSDAERCSRDERERGAEQRVLGAGLHARDAHVAAERDRGDAVGRSSCRGSGSPGPGRPIMNSWTWTPKARAVRK